MERTLYSYDANYNVTALWQDGANGFKPVERYSYDPYGKVTVLHGVQGYDPEVDGVTIFEWQPKSANPDGSPCVSRYDNEILYCGYRFDWETGLYNVRHRIYHPTLGRWTRRDPAGYIDGYGLYQYIGGGMAGATDPSGMWTYRFFGSTEPIEIAGVEMKTWWDFFRKGTFGNLMVKQFVDWRIGVETTYSLNIGVAGATGPRHAPGGPADLDSGTLFSLHWRKKSMEWPTFLVIEDGHMMWHDNWRVGLHGLETKFERLNNKLCMRNVILKQGKCRIQKNGYNNFID